MEPAGERETRRFDAFETRLVALSDHDLGALHTLTVSVNWPHRPQDIRLLQEVGSGFLVRDEIDRPLASGFHFRMGDFATIGMMITLPRLQALGAGSWMLEQVLEDAGAAGYLLNSTRRGYALYEKAGFRVVRNIHQHQGIAGAARLPADAAGGSFRDLGAGDRAAVLALDRAAFGADRAVILERLLDHATGRVAVDRGQVTGFALMRTFGQGRVIGPIICADEATAIGLIAPLIRQAEGTHLRVDVPAQYAALGGFLHAAGLGIFDRVIEMTKGKAPQRGRDVHVMGLAAHAFG